MPSTICRAISAVLLPDVMRFVASAVPPRGSSMPALERAPILPNLRPSGPVVLDAMGAFEVAPSVSVSAVLIPDVTRGPAPVVSLMMVATPALDPFPFSALPPSALPNAPEALTRTTAPHTPFAVVNAAVEITGPDMAPMRVLPMIAPARPLVVEPPMDPDAAPEMPLPDAGAIARLIEDAQICWGMADLPVEAQWAEVSVDVALDEWNMPSAASITFTGFAHVASGAAEDAYRAAHSALTGCAMASEHTPATAAATLLFDRNGVHLR